MMNWIRSLFTKKKERKRHIHIDNEKRNNVIADYDIRGMNYTELAVKYSISPSTVGKIIRKYKKQIHDSESH